MNKKIFASFCFVLFTLVFSLFLASSAKAWNSSSPGKFVNAGKIPKHKNNHHSKASSAKDITVFTFAYPKDSEYYGSPIEIFGMTITNVSPTQRILEIEAYPNSSFLIPTITISPKATISPKSGVAQEFGGSIGGTNPFIYTVTAQDGSKMQYSVILPR